MFLDSDDALELGCLNYLADIAESTDADMIFGLFKEVKEGEEKVFDRKYGEYTGVDKFLQLKGNVPWLNGTLIKRELWDKVEYCPRRFVEDTPTLWKLLYYSDKVIYTDKVCYDYYHRDNSLIHSASPYKRNLFECYAIIDVLIFLGNRPGGISIIKETGIQKELFTSFMLMKLNQPFSKDKDEYQKEREFIDKFIQSIKS